MWFFEVKDKFYLGCVKANGIKWVKWHCIDLSDSDTLRKDLVYWLLWESKSIINMGDKKWKE